MQVLLTGGSLTTLTPRLRTKYGKVYTFPNAISDSAKPFQSLQKWNGIIFKSELYQRLLADYIRMYVNGHHAITLSESHFHLQLKG